MKCSIQNLSSLGMFSVWVCLFVFNNILYFQEMCVHLDQFTYDSIYLSLAFSIT